MKRGGNNVGNSNKSNALLRHTVTREFNGNSDVLLNVEDSRKAIERKMIYLSEGNHTATMPRAQSRRKSNIGVAATVAGGNYGVTTGKLNDGPRRINTIGSGIYDASSRLEGGYNVQLDSPRRNGLTPRNLLDDDDAATSGTVKGSSSSIKQRQKRNVILKAEQQHQRMSNIYSRGQRHISKPLSSYAPQHEPVFACSYCGAKFHIKSLLGAHRRTHDDDLKMRYKLRRSNTALPRSLCKFCDRTFDLERTLHIHQMCHCKKISPQQRRKLGFTELLHEKKAPLPSFQHQHREMSTIALTTKVKKQPFQPKHSKSVVQNVAPPERWR